MRENLPKGKLLLFLLFFLAATSCKDKEDGCQDITASNWDSSADISCEDCCTYPQLQLSFTHAFGDTTLNLGDPYTDSMNTVYSILSARYYLSNISLKTNGTEFIVSDSITANVSIGGVTTESEELRDDVILVSRGIGTTSIGEFPINGEYLDTLFLDIGVVQPLNSVVSSSLTGAHPLGPKTDSMYWDESRGYIFQRFEIIPDTSVRDTIVLEIGGDDLLKTVSLPYGQTSTVGFNVVIPIKVDYEEWFKGINFASDTQEEMKEKIVLNLADGFSISE